ncbi:MAG: hypothetical protein BGO12_19315 [Verrucomicrobia bacterium 61-8]|nr:hypothetical protein [Verrucomicrobiota bacterium]OJV07532.1 MAG: hypothetical protein BGO12_19315 [Verrucomicrobia bacterium 61-8]
MSTAGYCQHPNRDPRGVPGPFYSRGQCLACAAPQGCAPALVSELAWDDLDTFFIRQPGTAEEVEQACAAIQICCVSDLRYGGQDPAIIARLGNTREYSDFLIDKSGKVYLKTA